jgi:hypothetical protein
MIKKMSFCAEMTQKLLSGEMSKIIVPAPDFKEQYKRVILDNRVYEVDSFNLQKTFCRLPIPLGSEVGIMRTLSEYYRDGKLSASGKELELLKKSFAWGNRTAIPHSDLKEAFMATGVRIERTMEVPYIDWADSGYAEKVERVAPVELDEEAETEGQEAEVTDAGTGTEIESSLDPSTTTKQGATTGGQDEGQAEETTKQADVTVEQAEAAGAQDVEAQSSETESLETESSEYECPVDNLTSLREELETLLITGALLKFQKTNDLKQLPNYVYVFDVRLVRF